MATAKKAKSKPKKKAPAKKPAISRKAAPSKKKPAVKKPAVKKAVVKKAAAKPAVKPAVKPPPAKQPPVVQPAAKPAPPPRLPAVTLSAVAVAPRGTPKSKATTAVVPDHSPLPSEDPVGIVTHYFNHLSVAVVQLDVGSLEVGDTVRFLGHTTDHRQKVESLEVNHRSVVEVGRRQAFGMKVKEHVREHDVVYKVGEF